MRKLINFYRILYCYLVLYIFAFFILGVYYFSTFVFIFIDINSFNKLMDQFVKDFEKIIMNKIAEIKKYEFDLLNQDIRERYRNGEAGLRLKQLNWWKEVIITICLLFLALYLVCGFMKFS